jgi:hypothetical protein
MRLFAALVWVSLLGVLPASGQEVFQQVMTNSLTYGRSAPVPNQHQNIHVIYVFVSDGAGAGSCSSGWTGQLQLEGSFDGAKWFLIGTPVRSALSAAAPTTIRTSAVGTYPQVAVNYITGSNSGATNTCALTVDYVGYSGYPPSSSVPNSALNENFNYLEATGLGSSTNYGTCPGVGQHLVVYSLVAAAGTANASFTFAIEDDLSSIRYSFTMPVAAYNVVVWPPAVRPYVLTNPAFTTSHETLWVNAPTTATWMATYRCEN